MLGWKLSDASKEGPWISVPYLHNYVNYSIMQGMCITTDGHFCRDSLKINFKRIIQQLKIKTRGKYISPRQSKQRKHRRCHINISYYNAYSHLDALSRGRTLSLLASWGLPQHRGAPEGPSLRHLSGTDSTEPWRFLEHTHTKKIQELKLQDRTKS
jgi:hypothetical protein